MKGQKARKAVIVCHLCRQKTDDTHFCYGCKVHICVMCDINWCTGKHVPIDHFRQMPGEYDGGES